jgi:hypothetical protein
VYGSPALGISGNRQEAHSPPSVRTVSPAVVFEELNHDRLAVADAHERLGFYARENRDEWSRKALQAALLIAAGADPTWLTEWIEEGQQRAERIR